MKTPTGKHIASTLGNIKRIHFAGVGLMIDGFADRRAQIYSKVIGEESFLKVDINR